MEDYVALDEGRLAREWAGRHEVSEVWGSHGERPAVVVIRGRDVRQDACTNARHRSVFLQGFLVKVFISGHNSVGGILLKNLLPSVSSQSLLQV